MHHEFYQYGDSTTEPYDPSRVHRQDGKVWHPNAVTDGTAPEYSCECEHTSLVPIERLKDFLASYKAEAASDASLENTFQKGVVHRNTTLEIRKARELKQLERSQALIGELMDSQI